MRNAFSVLRPRKSLPHQSAARKTGEWGESPRLKDLGASPKNAIAIANREERAATRMQTPAQDMLGSQRQ